MREFDSRPTWALEALCRGSDTAVFYPARGVTTAPQRAVCRACPVRAECIAQAVTTGEKYGLWGGLAAKLLRRLRTRGEVVTLDGDGVLFDADTGEVVIIENEAVPVLDVDEALDLLASLQPDAQAEVESVLASA